MRYFYAIIVTAFLLTPFHAFAETKEIIAEGAYNMGDGETPTVAESRALLQAKRTAVEEAGTYVESYSKTKNFQLTADEIQVLAAGVMEVEVLEKNRMVVGDGFNFWLKIKARVSTDKMEEMAKRVKEKSVVEDYKKIQEAYDKSQKEIEELKRQLAGAKGEKERKRVEARIIDEEILLQANEWFEKGHNYHINSKLDEAIEAYTNTLALYPSGIGAYINRGAAYAERGQYDRAIEDYNNAIALKDPNDADAYYNRGLAYYNKGQYDRAIEDYNKAITLEPNFAYAYHNRGFAYYNKRQYGKAIDDYNKAIALNPDIAEAYNNRGNAYAGVWQLDRAIENYNKAIALNPNYAIAYYNRGAAYYDKGNMGRAISDFQKACDMGNEMGCRNLQKALGNR